MVRQLSDEVCHGLRQDIKQFLAIRPDLTITDLTQLTILADSTGRSFYNGSIPGGIEVISELTRVLALAKAGDVLQPGASNGAIVLSDAQNEKVRRVQKTKNFYATRTVERVAEVLDYCAKYSAIGVITADFGAGKTEAVHAWRRAHGRKVESLVYEFDEFSSSNKVECVHGLARMLGIEITIGSAAGGKVFRDVCQRLREVPCLLIFDQCETVRARIFQIIRQLWDRTNDTGVGVVLLSAPVLLTRMNHSRMTDLGALTSRVGVWAPLSGVSKKEMASIVKQEGVTNISEGAFDLWWQAIGGSMRRLMRGLDLLKDKHAGSPITEKTIAGVASHLWGMSLQSE